MNPQQYPGGIISPQHNNENSDPTAPTTPTVAAPPAQPVQKPVHAFATKGGVVLDSHAPNKRSLRRTYAAALAIMLTFGGIGSYLLFTSHADTRTYANGEIITSGNIMNADGSNRLTSSRFANCGQTLQWSWTGNQIACKASKNYSQDANNYSSADWSVRVYTPDGSYVDMPYERASTLTVNGWSSNPATDQTNQSILYTVEYSPPMTSTTWGYKLKKVNPATSIVTTIDDGGKGGIFDDNSYTFSRESGQTTGFARNFIYSPDNTHILYTYDSFVYKSSGTGVSKIYICSYDVSTKSKSCNNNAIYGQSQSSQGGESGLFMSEVRLSPDGMQLAWAQNGKIYTADADGSNQQQVGSYLWKYNLTPNTKSNTYNYVTPSWSPDGKSLLYTAYASTTTGAQSNSIYRLNLADKTTTTLLANGRNNDGSFITERPISELTKPISEPTPSSTPYQPHPSGPVYSQTWHNNVNATTVSDLNGQNQVLLDTVTAPTGYVINDQKPAISSDGRQIAYIRIYVNQKTGNYEKRELVLQNTDGTNLRVITTPAGYTNTLGYGAAWSPDNLQIVLSGTDSTVSPNTSTTNLIFVNVVTGTVTIGPALPFGSGGAGITSWANSNYIYYFVGGAQLCRVAIDGNNQACEVLRGTDTSYAVKGSLSPDGTKYAYVDNRQLVIRSGLSGSETRTKTISGIGGSDTPQWTGDATKVFFSGLASNNTTITYSINADGTNLNQVSGYTALANDSTWGNAVTSAYAAISPTRVTDTRAGSGQANAGRTIASGGSLDVQVAGVNGLPASGVDAVVANVTEAGSAAPGFLSVGPSGSAKPNTSSLNFVAGQIVNNQTTAKLGSNGKITVYNNSGGRTDVVVDIVGYYSASGVGYTPITPARATDTRTGSGQANAGKKAGTSKPLTVKLIGVGGIPANATAAVVNAAVVAPGGPGFLTLYPTGQTAPNASSLNYTTGLILAKEATVKIGTNGSINVQANVSATDVVVDVVGYYTADGGSRFVPLNPTRIADTRNGSGQPFAGQHLNGSSPLTVNALGISNTYIPSSATGLATNLSVAVSNTSGFLSTWPANTSRPNASSLNFPPNTIDFNENTVALSPNGTYNIASNAGSADVIVDLLGYYTR